jgi:curved DNA-binding protein CbpA
MKKRDYYEVLEVHPKASKAIIDKAYHILAKKYHPDAHSSYKKKWAEAKFKELSEAYEVLSNSEHRKSYDQSRSISFREEVASENSSNREKAYFYYRTGLEYYKRVTQKQSFWYGYIGKWKSDLTNAQHNFLEVINIYSNTPYVEDARYYYFCTLTKEYNYTKEHQDRVEEEFKQFLSDYSNSKWIENILLELASFYILKGFKFDEAIKVLEELLEGSPSHNLVDSAYGLLECVREEKENRARLSSFSFWLFKAESKKKENLERA